MQSAFFLIRYINLTSPFNLGNRDFCHLILLRPRKANCTASWIWSKGSESICLQLFQICSCQYWDKKWNSAAAVRGIGSLKLNCNQISTVAPQQPFNAGISVDSGLTYLVLSLVFAVVDLRFHGPIFMQLKPKHNICGPAVYCKILGRFLDFIKIQGTYRDLASKNISQVFHQSSSPVTLNEISSVRKLIVKTVKRRP